MCGVTGYTCAHLALQGGHLNILQHLLAKGANVNEPDGKSGRTLLHMAADLGYIEALDLLLRQQNVNLNARTYGGLTAISLAHGRRLNDVVEWLYRSGADCAQLSEDSGDSTDEEMVSGCEFDVFWFGLCGGVGVGGRCLTHLFAASLLISSQMLESTVEVPEFLGRKSVCEWGESLCVCVCV